MLLAIAGAFALTSIVAVHVPSDGASVPSAFTCAGQLTLADRGHVVECEFVAPAGIAQVDIDASFRHADRPTQLDLGLRSPAGLRGWSQDRHDHIHVDSNSASYGYLPGKIEPGKWTLLVGVTNITETGVSYRVDIRLSATLDQPRLALDPYERWYVGDLHTHSGHSDGYHTATDGSRRPVTVEEIQTAARRADLDFVAITDHNTASQWLDVDRAQPLGRGVLLLHGEEITTYEGHFNTIGVRRAPDFSLSVSRPMSQVLREAMSDGGFVSINHPDLPDDDWCRGCRWRHLDAATLDNAQGVEVQNGPLDGDDLKGWRFWADLLNAGYRLVAVGGSDAHDPDWPTHPVGRPATVVHASSLSEEGLVDGLKHGRAYVRTAGAEGPWIVLSASGGHESVEMGSVIHAGPTRLTLAASHAKGQECHWIRRGETVGVVRIKDDPATLVLDVDAAAGDWFSVILITRGHPTVLSNAIYVDF
jgi:predicted metal-dependent phosphoesterase TrpH